mgnify:FL=1|jgi:hypothetical protein
MSNEIIVQDTNIKIRQHEKKDFISLTDIARYRDLNRSDYILQNWMRSKDTIEFLGLWEKINNQDFNSIEFDGIKNQAGVNSFILTPKQWISTTNAIGISQQNRLESLNKTAISQMNSLINNSTIKKLGK